METALITGASVGIGYELAKTYARHGYRLVLTARNQTQLGELARKVLQDHKAEAHVIACDLAKPDGAGYLCEELKSRGLTVDTLINNAGFGLFGRFAEVDMEKELSLLQVNIVALTQLTRLLLPGMLERKHGHVVNIASTAAFVPGPGMAIYYASKAYVLSFSEALEAELSGSGVKVTVVCPGPTATEFMDRAGMNKSRILNVMRAMTAQQVAKDTYNGVHRGDTVVIPGAANRVLSTLPRLLPRSVVPYVVKKINQPL